MRCVLVGNYGVGNLGDEALKEYFLCTFLDVSWTIVASKPKEAGELPRLPSGLRSFFFTPWWKTPFAIYRSDAVVFGGGSLFTDTESVLACVVWFIHASAAFLLRKPVLLAFQGIGPFRTSLGERLAKVVLKHAHFVSVRDQESARRIQQWNAGIHVVQSFDPIILDARKGEEHKQPSVLILIPRRHSGDQFLEAAKIAAKEHPFLPIKIVLLQSGDPREKAIATRLRLEFEDRSEVKPVHTIHELVEEVSKGVLVVSERYHGAIAAMGLGVPLTIVAQAKKDKLDELRAYSEGKLLIGDLVMLVRQGTAALRQSLLSLEKK